MAVSLSSSVPRATSLLYSNLYCIFHVYYFFRGFGAVLVTASPSRSSSEDDGGGYEGGGGFLRGDLPRSDPCPLKRLSVSGFTPSFTAEWHHSPMHGHNGLRQSTTNNVAHCKDGEMLM